jgi:hypothetical protein
MIAMKKRKYNFSLAELEELDDELNGRKDEFGVVIEPGLIDSPISLKLKFILANINSTVEVYRKKTIDYRNKLIYKLGTLNASNIPEIPMYIFDVVDGEPVQKPHPTFVKYEEMYTKYLTKVIEVESYPIDIDLLEKIERKERFPKLFKYIEQQYEEPKDEEIKES